MISSIKYTTTEDTTIELRITSYELPDGSEAIINDDGWTITSFRGSLTNDGEWCSMTQSNYDDFLFESLNEALVTWVDAQQD